MKDAVCDLRNQLRRPTKKPSTIAVLNAAKEEIQVCTQDSIREGVARMGGCGQNDGSFISLQFIIQYEYV